jgi:tRNA A37 N6-isopentenylltransferase MiaA
MFEAGLVDEVRELASHGLDRLIRPGKQLGIRKSSRHWLEGAALTRQKTR